jgi:enediyne biosynthesis protein E4
LKLLWIPAAVLGALALAQGPATRNAPPVPRSAPSGKPFPVRFTDVARAMGLHMKFTYGDERKKQYILEANGSGVAFLDYDNDGFQDVFLVNGSSFQDLPRGQAPTNHLYRNAGGGKFIDISRAAGVARSGWGSGVCVADIDNDGFDDFYVTYWGPNVLYRNSGKGSFEDVTARAGVAGAGDWNTGCSFLDYDRDGHLDLVVASYQRFDPAKTPPPGSGPTCEWKGMPVFCGPRGLPFGSVTLYHNRGDGTFEDVSAASGMRKAQGFYAFTAVTADLNGDGWPDIYIACDSTPSLLYRNNQDGTFTEVATEAGVAFNENGAEQGGMGVAAGDFDNDGQIDLLKTNFAGDYPNVYRNLGRGIFEDVVLRAGLAVNSQYVGWGIGLADFDNDGLKDIFQVNGHVYPELQGRAGDEQYLNPRLVYRNLGNGRFEDVSAMAGPGVAQRLSSRGAAFGDFDNDGAMDVLIMNMGEPPSLLRNILTSRNHWIKVKLQGTRSNRGAVGAAVTIGRQTEALLSQSSFLSHNDSRLHFGLGAAASVDGITVRWPSGAVEKFAGSPADRTVTLVEGTAP